MRHIKKQWIAIAFSAIVQMCLLTPTYATAPFPYTDNNYTANPTTNVGQVLKQTNQWWSLLENFLTLMGINYADPIVNGQRTGKAIIYVQVVINYVLALLGGIALVIILYSFFMMFIGKGDDAFAKARKTIIWTAIALFVIWLAWSIMDYLFYIYNKGL